MQRKVFAWLSLTTAMLVLVLNISGCGSNATKRTFSRTKRAVVEQKCRRCHVRTAGVLPKRGTISEKPVLIESRERFVSGKMSLLWNTFPTFSPDLIKPLNQPNDPNNDLWVGFVTNKALGGFASLSYAGNNALADYTMEAWVFVAVDKKSQGSIHGIAVRVDPEGLRFYRLAAQFGEESRITLAYVGADESNFPVYLRTWREDEIPGGIPKESGWHLMKLRVEGNQMWSFWDSQDLPGGPVSDDRIKMGYFGVYTNYTGAEKVVRTYVDDIQVHVKKAAVQ